MTESKDVFLPADQPRARLRTGLVRELVEHLAFHDRTVECEECIVQVRTRESVHADAWRDVGAPLCPQAEFKPDSRPIAWKTDFRAHRILEVAFALPAGAFDLQTAGADGVRRIIHAAKGAVSADPDDQCCANDVAQDWFSFEAEHLVKGLHQQSDWLLLLLRERPVSFFYFRPKGSEWGTGRYPAMSPPPDDWFPMEFLVIGACVTNCRTLFDIWALRS